MNARSAVAPLFAAFLLAASSTPALAQATRSAPQAVPIAQTIPDARDVAYPGTVRLDIDATDLDRALFRVTQVFPVEAGARELVLLFPQWLPGNHSPRGPLNLLTDVRFEAGGRPLTWVRDPVEVYAFRVALPAGTRAVTARMVHTSPLQTNEGRIVMTQEMLNLQWEKMSLYPAGHYVRQIKIAPTVTFPEGWSVFTALDGQRDAGGRGNRVTWATTDYETLVDSPIFAGKHAMDWDLGHSVRLQTVADEPGLLAIAPENLKTYEKLVDEAFATFGSPPFDHYDFLLALTDRMGGIGLEHQRSSENQYDPTDFTEWDKQAYDRNVISHELVHSWNGKHRRPAKLWTPDYRQPMQDNLLWMYEGQTQFWGWVLAARSGIQPKDIVLGAIANNAGYYSVQPGRAWRSVEDTTHDPIINSRRPRPYTSIHRDEDYYSEGLMVWLEVDQVIRDGTQGARGLDDFAKAFFEGNGDLGQRTYEFEDIVASLTAIFPYDWSNFLTARFQTPGAPPPLGGVEQAGYRLVWKEEPNPYRKGQMAGSSNFLDLLYSLGVNLDSSGEVTQVMWDSPAFDAGLVDGVQIVAVNGRAYSHDAIRGAITAAKGGREPIQLIAKRGTRYLTVPIAYHGGLRYPWIEPASDGEQPLDRLLAPRTGS
ncbi:MAG: peptidase M61 [Sphingomonadales bacterium 12-68-11]|nr:MAG: peptidase M61 [Sphingomonadales bacterium 12-68-11]